MPGRKQQDKLFLHRTAIIKRRRRSEKELHEDITTQLEIKLAEKKIFVDKKELYTYVKKSLNLAFVQKINMDVGSNTAVGIKDTAMVKALIPLAKFKWGKPKKKSK